ncbi:hypothetical protein Patl1_04626 [Pistacia atlantica]|uniref:Uncharacterized protein n=1 Tax=Pistacia atlantica TaxID=434234 RepID=A0ACC1BQ13_9ROSI|nr:hypothetical protein Patl1_04626 [Pistacia atlantica]
MQRGWAWPAVVLVGFCLARPNPDTPEYNLTTWPAARPDFAISAKHVLALVHHDEKLDRLDQFVEEVNIKLERIGDSILNVVSKSIIENQQGTIDFIKAFKAKVFDTLAKHQAQVEVVKMGLEEMKTD